MILKILNNTSIHIRMGNKSSLVSLTEIFAFPYEKANQFHYRPKNVQKIGDICFVTVHPHSENNINDNKYKKIAVFCHGNCMTVSDKLVDQLKLSADKINMDIIAVEYPGYGEARRTGPPTAENCVAAVKTVIDHLLTEGYQSKNIYIIGYSLGTGIAANVVYNYYPNTLGGIVLISPFKSVVNVAINDESLIYSSVSSMDFYKTCDIIHEINIPILIIHGEADDVINVSHSRHLQKKNKNVVLKILAETDHIDILTLCITWMFIDCFCNVKVHISGKSNSIRNAILDLFNNYRKMYRGNNDQLSTERVKGHLVFKANGKLMSEVKINKYACSVHVKI